MWFSALACSELSPRDAESQDSSISTTTSSSIGAPGRCPDLAPVSAPEGPVVTLVDVGGVPEQRLPCYRASGDPACALRIYQVMVESFVDGDPTRGYGVGYGTSHHQGDLRGVTEALPSIADLGANAVWTTPFFDSDTDPDASLGERRLDATGYFARDYFSIDPNFGDPDVARELVDTAHGLGLKVLFDGVFGHHKGGVTPSPQGHVPTDGNPVAYPDSLPFYQELVAYWIDELGIDGWRLDQAYQVPSWAWADLRSAADAASLAAHGRPSYLVAEVWTDPDTITRSVLQTDAGEPALDSAFDFPLRYALVETLAVSEGGFGVQPATHLAGAAGTRAAYPDHAMPNLMLGNHDLVRFGDLIERGGLPGPADPTYWARHRAATSFLAATSGPITLYYGEESGDEVPGFAGHVADGCADLGLCDDHVARTSGRVEGVTGFVPSADEAALRASTQCAMSIRADHPALYDGGRLHLYSDDAVYVDLKVGSREKVLYLLNVRPEPRQLAVAEGAVGAEAHALVDLATGEVFDLADPATRIALPGLSARFLRVWGTYDEPAAGAGFEVELFVRGDFDGWQPVDALTPRPGAPEVLEVEVELEPGTRRFKVGDASADFAVVDLGGGTMSLGQPKVLHRDDQSLDLVLEVPAAGRYTFTLDATDTHAPVLTVTAAD
ncbi:MAG: alpha-amylase family protein [Myxococcota bacterium]